METMATDNLYPSPVKDVILETKIETLQEPKDVYFFIVHRPFLYKPDFVIFDNEKDAKDVLEKWLKENKELEKDPKKEKFAIDFYSEQFKGSWNKPESFIKKIKVRDLLDRTNWLNVDLDKEVLIVNI